MTTGRSTLLLPRRSEAGGTGAVSGSFQALSADIMRKLAIPAAVVVIYLTLTALPGRTRIPPRVSSDYCYQLLAANRLYDGLGLTTLQPVAPLQPWEWRNDWSFLTQWPAGYSLCVWGIRRVTGASALEALRWINVASCALALVGWFVWVKRVSPRGVTGTLLAAVAAGCSVTVAFLIDPTTDVVVVALLPYALLLTSKAVACRNVVLPERRGEMFVDADRSDAVLPARRETNATDSRLILWLVSAGLIAGGLFWIRYASVFIPLGIGTYLFIEWMVRRRVRLRDILSFTIAAAVPMFLLLAVNRVFGQGSAQSQMNLGGALGFHFKPTMLATAWWNFTALGFYDYHRLARWAFALWPMLVIVGMIFWKKKRISQGHLLERLDKQTLGVRPLAYARVSDRCSLDGWLLSACVVGALFVVLIGTTSVFGDKFDYVALERYYRPVRPLYFVLFATPVLWASAHAARISRRIIRVAACVTLLIACSWLVSHEWPRPYQRWLAAEREATPSGYWARCFTPGAAKLYGWLKEQASPELIVVSNFHEFVALETGLPTLPIPKNRATLDDWVTHITTARGITAPRVLFVLDPDIKWREYWIPTSDEIVACFALEPESDSVDSINATVYGYHRSRIELPASVSTRWLPFPHATPHPPRKTLVRRSTFRAWRRSWDVRGGARRG